MFGFVSRLNLGGTLQQFDRHDPARARTRARQPPRAPAFRSRQLHHDRPWQYGGERRGAISTSRRSPRPARTTLARSCITAANVFALDRVAADDHSQAAIPEPGRANGPTDCAVRQRSQHDGGTVLLANERERDPGTDGGSADAIRSRRHVAGDGAAARLLHEPHGTATAAGPVDRGPAGLPRHRAMDLRHLPAGAVRGLQPDRRLRHRGRGDHAHRRVAAEEPGTHALDAIDFRRQSASAATSFSTC